MNASRTQKIAYWISTIVVLILLSAAFVTYHLLYDRQSGVFETFGYPAYLVYPLAYLKLIAILVIVSHRYNDLRDMVYAAYFLNMILALIGHFLYGDFYGHAVVGMVALPISYLLGNRVRGRPTRDFFGRFTRA